MPDKYTYADVIIDPDDPKVEIGKEYYSALMPNDVLDFANHNEELAKLIEVDRSLRYPFHIKSDCCDCWTCLLVRKKEPEKKYVPFDFDDFTVRRDLMGKTIINNYGLDGEGEFRELMIIGFENKSDEDRDCWSGNGYTEGTIAMTVDGYFHADELLKECTFIDGSPCGILKGVTND